jgi:acetyltransferase
VAEGFTKVTQRAREGQPQARVEGVHLQPMIPDGHDVIIGAVQDPQFGGLVMFGSGGVEVEGLKDVDFALAPLPREEAESMLANTWAGRKLAGFRGTPPGDREAVLDSIIRLAQLAADFPQLAEVEVNPLRVLPPGQGALALDVRIKMAEV